MSKKSRAELLIQYVKKVSGKKQTDDICQHLESASASRGSFGGPSDDNPVETFQVLASQADAVGDSALNGLEAIIHETDRPAIIVANGSYDLSSQVPLWQKLGEANVKTKIETAIKSVGRIEAPLDIRRPYAGTGFVVGDHVVMTNRHVARIFAEGIGVSLTYTPGAAGFDPKREWLQKEEPVVWDVEKVLMIHPYWDMALLQIANNLEHDFEPLLLSTTSPAAIGKGEHVLAIGYPGKDSRGNPVVRDSVFDRLYGVKRLLPGEYDGPVEFRGRQVIAHDTSTLGGASGSALLHVESGQVIGLHYAGKYLESNYAVPMSSLAEDVRVMGHAGNIRFEGKRKPNPFMSDLWDRVEQGQLNESVELASDAEEFWFGKPKVEKYLPRFSFDSLSDKEFSWSAALSTAVASYVAYWNEPQFESLGASWNWDGFHFIKQGNTECFVAGNSDQAIVAFRGTEMMKLKDWLTDLDVLGTTESYGKIHRGFRKAFDSVSDQLKRAINSIGVRQLILTGHSLGGALALIAAAEWSDVYDVRSIYTFGQPAVGNDDFVEFLTDKYSNRYVRFVNDDDIVPMVPPNYSHAGLLKRFNHGNELRASDVRESHVVGDTCSEMQLKHLQAALKRERQLSGSFNTSNEEGVLPSVRDHSMARYLDKIGLVNK